MEHNNLKKERYYIIISITFLLMCLYVIFFPFFSKLLNLINPNLTICPFLKLTGNPCPLCGGTRYIQGLGNVFSDFTYLLHPFGFIIITIFLEVIYRFGILLFYFRKRKQFNCDNSNTNEFILKNFNIFVKIDIIIHTILIILFVIYEICFFIF